MFIFAMELQLTDTFNLTLIKYGTIHFPFLVLSITIFREIKFFDYGKEMTVYVSSLITTLARAVYVRYAFI